VPSTTCRLSCGLIFGLLSTIALAQTPPAEEIVANRNRVAAGKLDSGVLTIQLELRSGVWHPEAEDGPQLFVPAFGEVGRPAQIPGPLMRMPEGTSVHIKLTNKLESKATLYGLNARPGDGKASIELAPGESREVSFLAGAPGTYYYWARTTEIKFGIPQPLLEDSSLNGAFIVDPPGAVPADRIFVLSTMFAFPEVLHEFFEVVTINGKSYPYTEPLDYTEGENIRWRVINPSFSEHPMHLHGSFYHILSWGDFESDTAYPEADRQSVVTQNLAAGHTMMLEWKPEHPGRWLFHCHFHAHISSDERIPVITRSAPLLYGPPAAPAHAPITEHGQHDAMSAMNDMAGLVLTINVKPLSNSAAVHAAASPVHKIDLVIEPSAATGTSPTFTCSVREGKKIVASQEKSMGPSIVVTRGEPTEVSVLNHLKGPTTIHWHGLELDSYYDGVVGGGAGDQITPAIAPGASFVARFTPNRAGTFIYHTHAADPNQLSGGVYGALIVLEPGESFDPEHDKLLVVGSRDPDFLAKRLTINGSEQPSPMVLTHGVKYRLRLINMAPNLPADLQIGSKEHPATWRAIAKDGATLPSRLAKTSDASLHIASGETYDFEFQSDTAGEIPLQVRNGVNQATLIAKIVLQ
jgi:FtsP/CotA-like multicopper oxidase with cupredoxin domain